MNCNSISIRNQVYFLLLAKLDELWTKDFRQAIQVNKDTRSKLTEILLLTEQLASVLLLESPEQQLSLRHRFEQLH